MGYQQGLGTPRGFDRPKKAKSKTKSKTQRTTGIHQTERSTQSKKEVVDQALANLENLGSQTFLLAPFAQYFDRWLWSLQTVVDDFESSKFVEMDDQYKKDRVLFFSRIDAALREERSREASHEEAIRSLHGARDTLLKHDQEHARKLKEFIGQKEQKIKSLTNRIEALRGELDSVIKSKGGLLEGITRTRARREEEARRILAAAERELEEALGVPLPEEKRLLEENERQRQDLLSQLALERGEIERLQAEAEIDGSAEIRRVACENLAEAIKSLFQRVESQPATAA